MSVDVKGELAAVARVIRMARKASGVGDVVSVCGLLSHARTMVARLLRASTRDVMEKYERSRRRKRA